MKLWWSEPEKRAGLPIIIRSVARWPLIGPSGRFTKDCGTVGVLRGGGARGTSWNKHTHTRYSTLRTSSLIIWTDSLAFKLNFPLRPLSHVHSLSLFSSIFHSPLSPTWVESEWEGSEPVTNDGVERESVHVNLQDSLWMSYSKNSNPSHDNR